MYTFSAYLDFLCRVNETDNIPDDTMLLSFESHLRKV